MSAQSPSDWLDGFLFGVALVTSLHRQDTELHFAAIAVPPQSSAYETVRHAHTSLLRPHLDQLSEDDIHCVPNGPRELMDVVEQWLIKCGPWGNDTATLPVSAIAATVPIHIREKVGWIAGELYTELLNCIGQDFEVYRYTIDKRLIRDYRASVDQERFLILGSLAAAIIILGEDWL